MDNMVIPKEDCTGCGLCKSVCKKKCIDFKRDEFGVEYPVINRIQCVSCHACENICPSLSNKSFVFNKPQKVYVAWNLDDGIRFKSASGGVASGFYRHVFDLGWYATGAFFTENNELKMDLFNNENFKESCRNSKYVFCNSSQVYLNVVEKLRNSIPVLFIGLPCQVAAAKRIAERYQCSDKLVTCDIVCHGVAPLEYLHNHINHVLGKSKHIDEIQFRNPNYGTSNFMFTLSRNNSVIYRKRVKSSDAYQQGYHSALIYRENCYACKYARPERVSDITIGDFSGLGRVKPYLGEKTNISCVLINTDRGADFWNGASHLFGYEERPLEEALKVEKQLQHPSVKFPEHEIFLKAYKIHHDFDRAVWYAIRRRMIYGFIYEKTFCFELKQFLRPLKRLIRKNG